MADNQVILNADVVFDQTKIQQRFAQLERNLKFQSPFGTMARDTKTFSGELDRATTRVITLGTAFSVLSTASRLLRGVVESTIAVEKSLTSVNTIFRLTTDNLNRFSSSLFDISRETAQSFEKVAEAAQEFARQGLSVAETQKAVRAALLLSRDANLDVAESVRAITAATNSFNKEALSRLQVVNRLASVDAAFAVSSKDLAEALIRTGSAAADAGVSFNQFIGLVTAAQQISQRGGTVIAGALNTIFTRVNRKDTLDALDSLGIAITDVRGQALPTIQVLQNFAVAYDKMTGSIKNQAAELVGGVRQLNTLKATLRDLASEGSVFAQVQQVIARNSNEIERRNAARNQTLAAQASQVGTSAQQIGSNIGNVGFAPAAKGLLGSVLNNPITQALQEANGSAESAGGKIAETFLRGFGSAVVFGLGPIVLKVLSSITRQVTGNLLKDVAAITGLNSAEKERLAIEADIVAVYKAGGSALQQQLNQMTSLAEKAALVRGLMSGTGSMVTPASAIRAELQATGYTRTRRIPGMAGGYIPYAEEMAAVNAGVGGASPGAKPVLLNNFNFGGGKVGQIVANTSEYIVPHFAAGGGSAIFNQSMIQKMGMPPGAKPIAAGGYVPNAADGLNPAYSSAAYYQNLSYGGPPPPPLPPSSAVSAAQLAKDFERAQREITRAANEEARLAKKKVIEQEKGFSMLEKQNVARAGLSATELKIAQKYTDALAELREGARARGSALQASLNAPVITGQRSVYEIRPIFDQWYGGDDAAPWNQVAGVGGVGGGGGPAGVSSPGNRSRTDKERIRAVYRQQMVEEAQAARQPSIIAQNKRIASLQERLAAARLPDMYSPGFIGPRVPVGWSPTFGATAASAGPSWLSRINARLNSTGGSLALGLGLPFAGGLIGEGQGGTSSGIGRGALSNGLQTAGVGATVGSLFGPAGTVPGLAIGGVLGALYGAIGKASKSFEELSLELDQKTKKLGEELSAASEVFRIQSDLKDAMMSDNQEQVVSLKKQRSIAISRVSNPTYQGIIGKYLSNPEQGGVQIARAGNDIIGANVLQSNLMQAMGRGKMGVGDIVGSIVGLDGPNADKTNRANGTNAVAAAIGDLSESQLKGLRAMTKSNPAQALELVGRLAGMKPDQIKEMVSPLKTRGFSQGSSTNLASFSIFSAINDLLLREKLPPDGLENSVGREGSLIDLAGTYRTRGSSAGIRAGADAQIAQVRNQIALANPMLTDTDRLGLQGSQGAGVIASQFRTQRAGLLNDSKGKLIDQIREAGGNDTFVQRVEQLKYSSDVKNLIADMSSGGNRNLAGLQNDKLGTQGSEFRKELDALSRGLDDNTLGLRENTRANAETSRTLERQLAESKTFVGAMKGDMGDISQTTSDFESSVDRKDPRSVIESNAYKTLRARLNVQRRLGVISEGQSESTSLGFDLTNQSNMEQRLRDAILSQSGNPLMTGSMLGGARLGNATAAGQAGNSGASFKGGFGSVFAGLKQDMLQFAEVGRAVGESLNNSLGGAWGDFVTGAKTGKDAFKSFAASVLGDASRLLGSKALSGLLGMAFSGFGSSSGGSIGFAAGGMVPAMLTGGEYVVGPNAARRIGYDTLRRMNGMADGGLVSGGSGVRDDVPARLAPGSFVIKKSATSRIGADYMNALVGGQVQHRDLGGILLGALLGGGAGYLAGGKKGAIGGALLGGIGGYLHGQPNNYSGVEGGASQGAVLSVGQKIGLGLGASAGLGLLAAGISAPRNVPGPLADSQLNGYRQSLEAAQATAFGNRPSPYPILQVGPQGQQYVSGYTDGPATRRWAEGGGVDVPLTVGSAQAKSSGGAASVNVKIDIHNNGTTSSSATASDGGSGGAFQGDFANKLQKTVQGIVQQELVNQSRPDGFFSQRGRYLQR